MFCDGNDVMSWSQYSTVESENLACGAVPWRITFDSVGVANVVCGQGFRLQTKK